MIRSLSWTYVSDRFDRSAVTNYESCWVQVERFIDRRGLPECTLNGILEVTCLVSFRH